MSVACYLRISSRSQKVDSQKNEVMKWLEANNISLDSVEWYSDVESGTTMDRPEFKRLQQDIFDGKIKSIVLGCKSLKSEFKCSKALDSN